MSDSSDGIGYGGPYLIDLYNNLTTGDAFFEELQDWSDYFTGQIVLDLGETNVGAVIDVIASSSAAKLYVYPSYEENLTSSIEHYVYDVPLEFQDSSGDFFTYGWSISGVAEPPWEESKIALVLI
jgi:hypothetical protein